MPFSLSVIDAGYHEKRLLHHLLDNYNVLERPVVNESDPLQLSFGLTLMQIIDVVSRRRAPNKLALATDLIRKATETDESEKKKAARKSEKFCDAISTEANDLLMQGSWSRLPPAPSLHHVSCSRLSTPRGVNGRFGHHRFFFLTPILKIETETSVNPNTERTHQRKLDAWNHMTHGRKWNPNFALSLVGRLGVAQRPHSTPSRKPCGLGVM